MAYINVAEWSPDQVTDWLKGLDDSMYNYVNSFINNEVRGHQLLNIRPYELEQLGMHSIGHQEIVLEAVENLRNFHYNLDKENLQFMALHVATASRSLHRQLALKKDTSMIETQILCDITRTIATIKPLIGWLDRSPFQGQFQFTNICRPMLRCGLEIATIAQRERFVENPVEQIRATADKLERLANYIIQDITDPMCLQPASLNLVTLKKRESELGFNIEPSYSGIHRVIDIKHNSPAHNSGKIEDGDEIVQINYQTIVGWQYETVLIQLRESLPDVLLTLKKRPKHTKIYGQIYMQPYRLPSKKLGKRNVGTRWGDNSPMPSPSPRPTLLTVPDNTLKMPLLLSSENEKNDDADTDSICSDILTPTDNKAAEKESRLYYPKPRSLLQRRNTICGDELSGHKSLVGIPLWHERKTGTNGDPSSPSLRDKSVSFGFGLEITPRPTTCIGIAASGAGKFSAAEGSKVQFNTESKKLKQVLEQPNDEEQEANSKPGVCKVVRFDSSMKVEDYPQNEKYTCNVENTILETFEPIPFADDDEDLIDTLRSAPDKLEDIVEVLGAVTNKNANVLVEAVNVPIVVRRGRLDKSHSTPAYDNSGDDSDTPPPAIPRKELVTPPIPPPRPRKQSECISTPVPVPPPKPPGMLANLAAAQQQQRQQQQQQQELQQQTQQQQHQLPPPTNIHAAQLSSPSPTIPTSLPSDLDSKSFLLSSSTLSLSTVGDSTNEISELHTPTKARTLTLKKKHSLISKRRNVNLKILGTGDIQGHLYRRTKDKRGVTFWARFYFIMLDTILYGFRSKEATKASCVIFLPGFTVSLAKEVHSKPFAFKVYHTAKTFYFAAESQDALNQWVDFIRQATLALTVGGGNNESSFNDINPKELFSENDSSSEENESTVTKNLCTPSPQSNKENQATTSAAKPCSNNTPTSTKTDRRYLGSLRKLTKSSLPFKTSSSAGEKKVSNDIPVPTDQFRSYRKVPGGSFGIQIGANTPGYHDTSLHPFNNTSQSVMAVTPPPPPPPIQLQQVIAQPRVLALSSSRSSIVSSCDSITMTLGPPSSPAPIPMPLNYNLQIQSLAPQIQYPTPLTESPPQHLPQTPTVVISPTKSMKKVPFNFIHASNPNLVEFDFQTSRTLDYNIPKIMNSSNAWEAPNIQGFVTLKDLMLQKQEEEAQEMYNNRVFLGVEKKEEYKRQAAQKAAAAAAAQFKHQHENSTGSTGDIKVQKTQNRSLPKPPDYEISFKPDDEDIQLTRTKEGLKLRDFGYELISGDEPLGASAMAKSHLSTSRQVSNQSTSSQEHDNTPHNNNWKTRPFLLSSNKGKKMSSSNSGSSSAASDCATANTTAGERRLGSFKKKGKLDSFKSSSERIFQFGKHSHNSSTGVMTLPYKKSSHNSECTGVGSSGASGGTGSASSASGIKKSQTYNNDLKEKASKYDAQRKNSAPMPIFSKLSFSSSSSASSHAPNSKSENKKEKKLLGSPLLHRTVFGHHNHNVNSSNQIMSIPTTPTSTTSTCMGRDYDSEIFSQVTFRKYSSSSNSTVLTAPETLAPPPPPATLATKYASNANVIDFTTNQSSSPPLASPTSVAANPVLNPATPEYPNMECPPVFEPDIYSLTDPNASLLLRRNNNNNNNNINSTPTQDSNINDENPH